MIHFEDFGPGDEALLGSYDFTAERIVDFAREFDPQPFHLDEEAGRATLFGGLAASGWHTAAAWMKVFVAYQKAQALAGRAVAMGPSPGFSDMRWIKPVMAGDTITYYTRFGEKRVTRGRPEWGLVLNDNRGVNQNGETVFSFRSAVYVRLRNPEVPSA